MINHLSTASNCQMQWTHSSIQHIKVEMIFLSPKHVTFLNQPISQIRSVKIQGKGPVLALLTLSVNSWVCTSNNLILQQQLLDQLYGVPAPYINDHRPSPDKSSNVTLLAQYPSVINSSTCPIDLSQQSHI